jgi:anti-sigma factor RsiW
MTTRDHSMTCDDFEGRLSDYLERALSASDRAAMGAHCAHCNACAALVGDLQRIVSSAATLPLLPPSRDLWSGIAHRIDAPVTSLIERGNVTGARRTVSLRQLAAAAVLLVGLSSGGTYVLLRMTATPGNAPLTAASTKVAAVSVLSDVQPRAVAHDSTEARHSASPATSRGANASINGASEGSAGASREAATRRASYSSDMTQQVYEREISTMRRIVDERLGNLDSATVIVIERNLAIIDKAIADSKNALANDPHSGFLSTQLDRALEAKLSTLRRVALL